MRRGKRDGRKEVVSEERRGRKTIRESEGREREKRGRN